ncbi:MAG: twin-arginine translocase TatA/TatE family subunit [Thaumarchaeota archaeon]|jgi:sec-independent protein translocase protein TatA|nr:twin-arginine translocase TatA/TatE family subunit [Candidatus Terraquivivens yellowstonensis]MCL7397707.1 twin-arginine translocase TatA/TatE family subunit [Candidatus Terraquivivens yellowstonensis]MCL7400501.1 twin-arginine translocase TatA/TatE family subunit [Candidatus Terraquivivens yellowstonensis]
MAIVGVEWIVIIIIIVIFLIWGPSKIPELARSLGKAKKEFEKAMKEAEEIKQQAASSIDVQALKNDVDMLIDMAKKLGIPTEGRTRAEIYNDVMAKLGKST